MRGNAKPSEEKRILVVDDDDAIRSLLLKILDRCGMVVDTARNGAEAIDRLAHCRYALMLLDLMMPTMSGWEVLERLQSSDPPTRPMVVVLTAGAESREFNPEVVIGTIRKPFDVELLQDMVMACISVVAAKRQFPECPPAESETDELSTWHKS